MRNARVIGPDADMRCRPLVLQLPVQTLPGVTESGSSLLRCLFQFPDACLQALDFRRLRTWRRAIGRITRVPVTAGAWISLPVTTRTRVTRPVATIGSIVMTVIIATIPVERVGQTTTERMRGSGKQQGQREQQQVGTVHSGIQLAEPPVTFKTDVARVQALKAKTRVTGFKLVIPDYATLHPGYRFVQHLYKSR